MVVVVVLMSLSQPSGAGGERDPKSGKDNYTSLRLATAVSSTITKRSTSCIAWSEEVTSMRLVKPVEYWCSVSV